MYFNVAGISQLYSSLSLSIERNDSVGRVMKEADYRFFRENGYVSLGKILTDREVAYLCQSF